MFNENIAKELNAQLNRELFSGYLYLAMSTYFEEIDLPGMAHWMRAQADEEREHAMKFYNFIADRGAKIELEAMDRPQANFESVVAAFEASLEHEKSITAHINDLYELAVENKDYATQSFLDWFVTEQVEEENMIEEILAKFERAGDTGYALLIMDRELGSR